MDTTMQNELESWMQRPAFIPAEAVHQLEELLEKYPYFQLGHTLLFSAKVKNTGSVQDDDLAQASIYALDRSTLQQIVGGDNPWKHQSSETTNVYNTSIDGTLSEDTKEVDICKSDVVVVDDLLSEAALLTSEKLDQKQLQKDLVEKFIKNDPKIRPVKDLLGEGNELVDLSVFSEKSLNSLTLATESFAKILEKQGKFYKSIEIYEKLILKNPEKKDYFAKKIIELSAKIKE